MIKLTHLNLLPFECRFSFIFIDKILILFKIISVLIIQIYKLLCNEVIVTHMIKLAHLNLQPIKWIPLYLYFCR